MRASCLNPAVEMNGAADAQPTSSHSGPELLLAGEGDASVEMALLAGGIGGSGHQGDGVRGEGEGEGEGQGEGCKGEGEGRKGESEGEGADDLGGRSWTWALLRGGSSVCMAPAAWRASALIQDDELGLKYCLTALVVASLLWNSMVFVLPQVSTNSSSQPMEIKPTAKHYYSPPPNAFRAFTHAATMPGVVLPAEHHYRPPPNALRASTHTTKSHS